MFFISLSGKANYNMDSMVRYNLPVFVMLVFLAVQSRPIEGSIWKKTSLQGWVRSLWILGYLLALIVQIWMIRVFTKGGWVA
jgi:hypothetical protein